MTTNLKPQTRLAILGLTGGEIKSILTNQPAVVDLVVTQLALHGNSKRLEAMRGYKKISGYRQERCKAFLKPLGDITIDVLLKAMK